MNCETYKLLSCHVLCAVPTRAPPLQRGPRGAGPHGTAAEGGSVPCCRHRHLHPSARRGVRCGRGVELRGGRLLRFHHSLHHRLWWLRGRWAPRDVTEEQVESADLIRLLLVTITQCWRSSEIRRILICMQKPIIHIQIYRTYILVHQNNPNVLICSLIVSTHCGYATIFSFQCIGKT